MRKQEFRFQTNLPSPARRGSRSRTASPPAFLAIRKAPSASVESIQPRPPQPCEVGRPKGRRRKSRRQSHNFFSTDAAGGTPTRRHALGRLPTPPPLPENLLLGLHRKLPSAPPASTQEVPESENRPATRGTAHSEVQGDARCTARYTARCNVRPIAALHFLLPTVDSRSGRRSLIPNSSPFSRSTRFPFTSTPSPPAPLAIRKAPSGRRRKSRRQSHKFFKHLLRLAPQLAATPWGGSPPRPLCQKICYSDCKETCPLRPLRAPRRFRNPKLPQQR